MRGRGGMRAAILAAGLLLAAQAAGLRAQEAPRVSLSGRVTSDSKAALAGARVTLLEASHPDGLARTTTNAQGLYRFDDLVPGVSYSIQVEAPTWATIVLGPLSPAAGSETRIDVEMRLASELGETVHVEAEAGRVELAETSTGTSFSAEVIESLPLVGREFTDILLLAPGITDADGDGNVNVRGARDTGLQLRMDGANVTDPLTGQVAQGINLETVQDVEIITAGAPAEYGRTDGGFVNVITKSGGNEFDGSFKAFYRSDFLDGSDSLTFTDTDLYATLGGPLVRDHAWFFVSLERLDEETPVVFLDGSGAVRQQEGYRGFGKVTVQANPINRVSFQISHDPMDFLGNNIGLLVDPETDYALLTSTTVPQIVWVSTISPTTLLQTVVSHYRSELDIDPVSDDFSPVTSDFVVERNGNLRYGLPCMTPNCVGEPRLRRFAEEPVAPRSNKVTVLEEGPYSLSRNQSVRRGAIRSDVSLFLEGSRVQHAIKGGFEGGVDSYDAAAINNPIITERTCDITVNCTFAIGNAPQHWRFGSIFAAFAEPVDTTGDADGMTLGFYIQDALKPIPNLSISVGARFDHEEIDVEAYTEFDPRAEAKEVLRSYDQLCELSGPPCGSARTPGRMDGPLLHQIAYPPGHPAARFDLNQDGLIESSGSEGAAIFTPFTQLSQRVPSPIQVSNNNPSLRFSISWDPWSDGRTKLFGTWGQYYDRLFLGSTTVEQEPIQTVAEWRVGGEQTPSGVLFTRADPGELSEPVNSLSVNQVDRDLETPLTVEWTAGFERELAPEWSVGVTYISRKSHNLLQDVDINHIACTGFDETFGVKPYDVCGDGGVLEMDRFGRVIVTERQGRLGYFSAPNGAPDLYSLNPYFNQVLRVGNFNASTYEAAELTLRKRLHRNWQMQLAYTWSRARGDAESLRAQQGNDPAVSDKVSGYLDYDQTHIVKWESVVHFRDDLLLGGSLLWASGLPFSFVGNTVDYDDRGRISPQRIFSITGEKNDQRNESQLTINGRIEKRFTMGATQASAFIEGENLLDNKELVLQQIDQNSLSVLYGERRFGRRWQLGMAVYF